LDTYFAPSDTRGVHRGAQVLDRRTGCLDQHECGQFGQIAETMSTSRLISPAHPVSVVGSGLAWPLWLTFRKQPFAVVAGGQAELGPVGAQIGLGVGVVKRVHDADGLAGAARTGQFVALSRLLGP